MIRQVNVQHQVSSQSPDFRTTLTQRMAEYQERMALQIKRERDRRSWSRDHVAREIGVSSKTVERWEKAESAPQAENLRALAEFLDVPVDELRPLPETREEHLLTQLDRIEAKLDQALEALEAARVEQAAIDAARGNGEPREQPSQTPDATDHQASAGDTSS